ncbi:hypothetical protein CFB39_01250 [Burkholderia sp. AU6039]|nr:hypothetical protein CFB39_01250 [Burkholderia sp. AU6039]
MLSSMEEIVADYLKQANHLCELWSVGFNCNLFPYKLLSVPDVLFLGAGGQQLCRSFRKLKFGMIPANQPAPARQCFRTFIFILQIAILL